jgi:hypothetical protein
VLRYGRKAHDPEQTIELIWPRMAELHELEAIRAHGFWSEMAGGGAS